MKELGKGGCEEKVNSRPKLYFPPKQILFELLEERSEEIIRRNSSLKLVSED